MSPCDADKVPEMLVAEVKRCLSQMNYSRCLDWGLHGDFLLGSINPGFSNMRLSLLSKPSLTWSNVIIERNICYFVYIFYDEKDDDD